MEILGRDQSEMFAYHSRLASLVGPVQPGTGLDRSRTDIRGDVVSSLIQTRVSLPEEGKRRCVRNLQSDGQ